MVEKKYTHNLFRTISRHIKPFFFLIVSPGPYGARLIISYNMTCRTKTAVVCKVFFFSFSNDEGINIVLQRIL